MEKATQIFEKHWTKRTGCPLDEKTKEHMKYCIEAIDEALNLSKSNTTHELKIKQEFARAYFAGLTINFKNYGNRNSRNRTL